jgi:HK97 family phage major capsid protein
MSTHRKIPRVFEIARSAAVAVDSDHALNAAQRRTQDELRSRFQFIDLAHGVIIPWHESRYTGGHEPFKARDSATGNVITEDNRGNLVVQKEHRDFTATGSTSIEHDQGGMTVGTEVPEIGAAFRANLVLEKLGARILGGLRGNLNLPRAKASIDCEWRSETASGSDTDEALAMMALAPRRITATWAVSDQLLLQGEKIEPFIRSELMSALAVELQRVLIAGAGGNQPLGITGLSGIGSVVGGTDGAAPTYQNLCDLEFAVTGTAKADRGHLGWLVSPAGRKKLRNTPVFPGGSVPAWSEREAAALLGHAAGVTPSVPDSLSKGASSGNCSALIFGEFSELFVALFGPGVVVSAVREAAMARQGKTLLVASAYADGSVRTPAAFAAMLDALCV